MTKSFKRSVLVAMVVALLVLAIAAPASAVSASTRQVTPGISERTIWDSSQVAVYKLPHGVNHNGYIHMEVKFRPGWADLDIYLLNSEGTAVGGLDGEQGYLASFTGKEVIDFRVQRVLDQTLVYDPYTLEPVDMVGDTYYVVVVAFNETAKFQIWGYFPQIDLSGGTSTTNTWNYYMQSWRKPASADKWLTIHGPMYGGPYDFRPTSEGAAEAHLEWPADLATKTVLDDHANGLMPANMEQYLYAGLDWNLVFEDYGDSNWTPVDQGGWWGLKDTWNVIEGEDEASQPGVTLHYVPSLYLVSSDETQGPLAPPALGIKSMPYKATLIYPENLRITKVTKVSATKRKLFGTFALDGAWVAPGTKVWIQKKTASGSWKSIASTVTGADGKWSVTVTRTAKLTVRAKAAGNDATGLATEYSMFRYL